MVKHNKDKGIIGPLLLVAVVATVPFMYVRNMHNDDQKHYEPPVVSASPVKTSATPSATSKPEPAPVREVVAPASPQPVESEEKILTISGYRSCGYYPATAQRCIDKGLTLYHGNVLAGHDYMGYAWMASVPKGTKLQVTKGAMAGQYVVTGHTSVNRKEGRFPNMYGADLVLQTCSGKGTKFSLLKRV